MKKFTYMIFMMFLMTQIHFAHSQNNSKMSSKLQIVIPSVKFKDIGIDAAVDMIRRSSKKQDPDGIGINIILVTDSKKSQEIKVNLEADNMPVGEIIRYICKQNNLPYKVDKYAVVIGQSKNLKKMETKFYLAQAKLIQIIDDNFDGDSQKFLKTIGMKFGPGAKVALVRTKSRLVITNSEDEHKKIAKILKQL